ncbi:MAG: Chemotaxis protein histidine kinase-like protein [Comamonadaceae bacterium]|nr:MAG: Chemotaxis protein histidine kinase-like protein [Comamonadaceae bacterium]
MYLNEADEWSRRLLTELTEWSLELDRPLQDSVVSLAHSLAGSSATVGFMVLSELARAMEHALEHVQMAGVGLAEHAHLFVDVAEDIRRLLHQFAAGFLKPSNPEHLSALRALLETDFSSLPLEHMAQEEDWVQEAQVSEDEFASLFEPEAVEPEVIESEVVESESIEPEAVEPDAIVVDETVPEASESSHDVAPEIVLEPAVLPEPLVSQAVQVAEPAHEPAAHVTLVDSVPDEDIEARDVLDVDLFPIFEEEALELLPQLSAALRQWSAQSGNSAARQQVLRVLHTLKGSARLAGAMRLGEMAHRMESAVEEVDSKNPQIGAMDELLNRFDGLSAVFDALCALPVQALALPEVAAVSEAVQPEAPTDVVMPVPVEQPESGVSVTLAPASSIASMSPVLPLRRVGGQTIRIRSQLLDRMVNQAGEVMITRSRLEARLGQLRGSLDELTSNLDRLRHQLRDVELQSESQMQSRLAQAKDSAQGFDPLEFDRFTRVQELTRMMAESVHDVATLQRNLQQTVAGVEDDLIAQARQTRELQRDLLRTRMVEFESISERLYGVVRQAAKDVGKSVKLDIVGGSLEMDRGVLDRMAPAFEHLLRNAVGHGIENPPWVTSRSPWSSKAMMCR